MIPRRRFVTRYNDPCYSSFKLFRRFWLARSIWWKICLKPFAPSLKKKVSRLSEDEKAELLTNTERKKCRNTQNISHYVVYVIGFLSYLQEKLTSAVKPCQEVGKTVWKRRSKLAENFKIFYLNILNFWRIKLMPVGVRITNLLF